MSYLNETGLNTLWAKIKSVFQEKLVSGTNIKTVNNNSLLGSGNITIGGGGGSALDAYPVGSIYMSINNTSPATLFGGTWSQIKDTFLLSAGDNYQAGTTGGSAEIPYHRHTFTPSGTISNDTHSHTPSGGSSYKFATATDNVRASTIKLGSSTSDHKFLYTTSTGTGMQYASTSSDTHNHTFTGTSGNTGYAGNSESTNNMPPYLTVYMWQRTA